ncbi:P-loop containing nucleoside triphosphate hydrolase protein [Blastocladiella britannica]|nr:P-loop containing nucleoside triphosphate hydrolase protein [Blastocladiella britannica]
MKNQKTRSITPTPRQLAAEANRILEWSGQHDPSRLIISIAGVPGAGKTTVAEHLARAINDAAQSSVAVALSMDGIHYPKAVLDTFSDPARAHRRRGSPYTFDAPQFLEAMRQLKSKSSLIWPTFSHAVGDPDPTGLIVEPRHHIAIVEGLYVGLTHRVDVGDVDEDGSQDLWLSAAQIADERWWVDAGESVAEARLAARHVECGLEPDLDAARARITNNDGLNAHWIRARVDTAQMDVVVDNS